MWKWLGRTLLLIFVGVPVLALATCTYTTHSPHLRLDGLNAVLMDAPRHPERGWRTIDVDLVPAHFQLGQDESAVTERLRGAGYAIFSDFSTDVGPLDPHPNDSMSQADLDKMFAESRRWHNERGITHVWSRPGPVTLACADTLFVELGLVDGALTRATGYSRYTCF